MSSKSVMTSSDDGATYAQKGKLLDLLFAGLNHSNLSRSFLQEVIEKQAASVVDEFLASLKRREKSTKKQFSFVENIADGQRLETASDSH